MAKYFILFNSSVGSLAVEKFLYEYFREHFAGCTVMEDHIGDIIDCLADAQAEFFKTHRGQSVPINCTKSQMSDTCWLSFGKVSATLHPIKEEL